MIMKNYTQFNKKTKNSKNKCVLKNIRRLSHHFVFGQNIAELFAIKQKVLKLQSPLGMRRKAEILTFSMHTKWTL